MALNPNLIVDIVYSIWLRAGVAHKIIKIRDFPLKLDFKILVRGEFLYGIWFDLPSLLNNMTCVRKNKLLLICNPSYTLSLLALLFY